MAQVYPYRGLLLFVALKKVLQLQIMVGMRRKTGQKIDQATFMFSEQETIWFTSRQLRWRENETWRHLVFGEKEGGRQPWLQSPLARGRAAWAASWELSFNFNSPLLSIHCNRRRCFAKVKIVLIERMTRVVKDDYQDDADGVCLDVCAHRGREKAQPTNEPPIQCNAEYIKIQYNTKHLQSKANHNTTMDESPLQPSFSSSILRRALTSTSF